MRGAPLRSAESYPDECWTFCNTVALAATRLADALDGTDHADLRAAWCARARRRLVDPGTGMLVSSYTLDGRIGDGPEASSLFMAAHDLLVVDPALARDQYRRARRAFGRSVLGFGYAREWPDAAGRDDVDSGPTVPGWGPTRARAGWPCWAPRPSATGRTCARSCPRCTLRPSRRRATTAGSRTRRATP